MDEHRVRERVEQIISTLTPEQKLAQLNGMFCGAQVPVAILHRFVNGLGEIAVMPGTNHKEENLMAAQAEQDAVRTAPYSPSTLGLAASWDTEEE